MKFILYTPGPRDHWLPAIVKPAENGGGVETRGLSQVQRSKTVEPHLGKETGNSILKNRSRDQRDAMNTLANTLPPAIV